MNLADRITIEPGKRGGKPCIRRMRITVQDVLDWFACGMSEAEILEDFPDLEREDFRAARAWAVAVQRRIAPPSVDDDHITSTADRGIDAPASIIPESGGLHHPQP